MLLLCFGILFVCRKSVVNGWGVIAGSCFELSQYLDFLLQKISDTSFILVSGLGEHVKGLA